MTRWYNQAFTKFEMLKCVKDRIVDFRSKNGVWWRGIKISKLADIDYHVKKFPGADCYVTGFTFNWQSFIDDHGLPPSVGLPKEHNIWRTDVLRPNMGNYIITKDLVFDIDSDDLSLASHKTIVLNDWLKDHGIDYNHHVSFSGKHGYHIVVDDCERYFDLYDINLFKRTPDALAHCCIALWGKILDDAFPDEFYVDHGKRGRNYDNYGIHCSPMLPWGVRKAPYSMTKHETVVLPITNKILSSNPSDNYFNEKQVLNNFKIKNRGLLSP